MLTPAEPAAAVQARQRRWRGLPAAVPAAAQADQAQPAAAAAVPAAAQADQAQPAAAAAVAAAAQADQAQPAAAAAVCVLRLPSG